MPLGRSALGGPFKRPLSCFNCLRHSPHVSGEPPLSADARFQAFDCGRPGLSMNWSTNVKRRWDQSVTHVDRLGRTSGGRVWEPVGADRQQLATLSRNACRCRIGHSKPWYCILLRYPKSAESSASWSAGKWTDGAARDRELTVIAAQLVTRETGDARRLPTRSG